jgi:purine-binding chemotaxis protein CheW
MDGISQRSNNGSVDGEESASLVSTFYLGQALFGIDALQVQEVITLSGITYVHHAPEYISGIINLRGQIVTIVNLVTKLNLEDHAEHPSSQVLIVSWRGEYVGLLVDQVADVEETNMEILLPPPANLNAELKKYIRGVSHAGTRQVSILDVDRILDEEKDEI